MRPPSPGSAPTPLVRTAPVERTAGLFLLTAMAALWTWWALAEGAFFGTVLFAGGIVLYLVLVTLLGFAPLKLSAGGPQEVVFLALISLALWTVVTIAWTPARDLALEYSERTLLYAAAFAGGLWLTNLLSRRMALAVVPLALAGTVVCLVTIVTGWTADSATGLLDEEFTLDYPFGYRNAQACFLVMIAMLGTTIATRVRGPAWSRCGGAALAATAASLMLLCQSRGSIVGLAAGVIVFLIVSPQRGRALVALGVVAIPVLVTHPWMLEPFEVAGENGNPLEALQTAMTAAMFAGGMAALLMLVAVRTGATIDDDAPVERVTNRVLLAVLAVCALAVPVGLIATGTDPVEWVSDKVSSSESSSSTGSRFLYTGGLQRADYWSVALDQFTDSPLGGGGAGSFRSRYLSDRTSDQSPREAHSIEMELLGELGAPGLLLFCIAVGGGIFGAIRSRRLGPEAAFLTTAAFAVGAAFLAQASIDWFWSFAGLTAPVLALLGSAVAPQAYALREAASKRRRGIAIAAALAAVLTLVPLWLSERWTANAAENWGAGPDAALSALDRAASANPLADTPLLVEAEIARKLGEREAALEAIAEARTRQPTEFFNYALAAKVLASASPEAALREVELGLELNPRSQELIELGDRLRKEIAREKGPGSAG